MADETYSFRETREEIERRMVCLASQGIEAKFDGRVLEYTARGRLTKVLLDQEVESIHAF